MAAAKNKKPREILWTPVGRFSFPYFSAPDEGRQYSDGKYKCAFLIPKTIFKEKGKALQDAVLKVGREYFGKTFDLKSGKWKTPFKDTDAVDVANPAQAGCILIRAKSVRAPIFIGPRKVSSGQFPNLTSEEVQAIKGGDWGTLNVTVYPYDQSGGGITLGLNSVQFWKSDEGFGQGTSAMIKTAEELETEIDDASEVVVDDDSII